MTLGLGSTQKWTAEPKWEYPESNIKDLHTNRSARNSPKCTRKIAQDLLESIDKAFPHKTNGYSILQKKKRMNQSQTVRQDWKRFL